jgi:hypothetical protein
MSFLQHKQGPGSVTYMADAAILLAASEIMKSYLKQVRDQTKIAVLCAESGADFTLKAGEQAALSAKTGGWSQIIGGTIGLGTIAVSLGLSFKTMKEVSFAKQKKINMEETLKNVRQPADNNQLAAARENLQIAGGKNWKFSDAEQKEIVTRVSNPNEYNQPLKRLNVPHDANQNEPINEAEIQTLLKNLQERDKRTIETNLKFEEEKLTKIIDEGEKKLQQWYSVSQTGQVINAIAAGSGEVLKAAYITGQASYEAAKLLASQTQEFTKQTDNINSQGAQNAFEQMQKALQSFQAVVGANTRA